MDVSGLLFETGQLGLLVLLELSGAVFCLAEVLLQFGQLLRRRARAQLQLDQFPVTFLDLLHVLLVSDLHLMEINELKVITHFFLLLDLSLSLENGNLESDILLSEFLNLRLFL